MSDHSDKEPLHVLTADGQPTNVLKQRMLVHRDGDWHRAIHLWLLNSRGELLIQRRAMCKDSYAGMWDVSVGGHCEAFDEPGDTVIKECKEELGLELKPVELQYLYTRPTEFITHGGTFVNREHLDVYLVERDVELSELRLQPEEVLDVKWVRALELEESLRANDPKFVPCDFEFLLGPFFELVRKRLSEGR